MVLSHFKVNCSSIGALMSNAKDNKLPTDKQINEAIGYVNREEDKITDRMAGVIKSTFQRIIEYDPYKLSTSFRAEVARIYAFEMYGKRPVSLIGDRLAVEKGLAAEPESLKLLSRVDGIEYAKNDSLIVGRWIKGKPDVIVGRKRKAKTVIDVKTSLDFVSFLRIVEQEKLEPEYMWQMLGYIDLTNCEVGQVCYCLTDMPERMIDAEIKKICRRHSELGIPIDVTEQKILEMRNNMTYQEIPERMRVKRFPVYRDDSKIKDMRERVRVARKWLKELHYKFQNPLLLQ